MSMVSSRWVLWTRQLVTTTEQGYGILGLTTWCASAKPSNEGKTSNGRQATGHVREVSDDENVVQD